MIIKYNEQYKLYKKSYININMNILDYYDIMDNNKYYHNKNIDNYMKENNISEFIICQLDDNYFYIKNDSEENYHTMFIKKYENQYQIELFRSIMRHDESIVTLKSNSYTCDKDLIIENIHKLYSIDKQIVKNIINFFESY